MKKTAYVTGSNGFLGINLCEELLGQGWRVLALHRPASDTRYLKRLAVEPISGDINEPDSLARTIPMGVDALFHDELGFQAVPLRRMVEDCYRWMKDAGQLDAM